MVSYNGSVHIYDTQTKRKVFTNMAHQAPCRDVAMSPVNDCVLVSVGYDHLINLFDTRTKIASVQLSTAHPLSAGAISPCGDYICVGNLKGQLLAYDFRNLSEPLIQTKAQHNTPVKRVEFLPTTEEVSLTENLQNKGRRDSMQHFFDHHYKRLPERKSNLSNLFSGENTSGTRISLGHDLKRLLREEEAVRSREHSSSSSSSSDVEFVGFTPGQGVGMDKAEVDAGRTPVSALPSSVKNEQKTQLVSLMSMNSVLEEGSGGGVPFAGNDSKEHLKRLMLYPRNNRTLDQAIPEQDEFVQKKANARPVRNSIQTSTPLNSLNTQASSPASLIAASKKLVIPEKYLGDGDNVHSPVVAKGGSLGGAATSTNTLSSSKEKMQGTDEKRDRSCHCSQQDVSQLELQLTERMERMEKQFEFRLEQSVWELKNYSTLAYIKQMEVSEDLQKSVSDLTAGMNCLIRSDDFIEEFFRLRRENEELKARLMGNGH